MRLATSGRPPAADDVAAALTAAVALLGQRPAVTGHVREGRPRVDSDPSAGGRREQGFASLAGWVAKGANLLHAELGLAAGDRLALAGPPGWPLAAVTLSAWWLGVTVVPRADRTGPGGPSADVLVAHHAVLDGQDGRPGVVDGSRTVLTFGDAIDGTTTTAPAPARAEEWTDAVTPHGDRPPAPAHDGDLVALVTTDGTEHTQRMLLARAAEGAEEGAGVLGMLRHGDEDLVSGPDAARRLAALALRPLVSGAATVIIEVDDAARNALARAERVARWLEGAGRPRDHPPT